MAVSSQKVERLSVYYWVGLLKVMEIPHSLFEEKLEKMKAAKGIKLDTDLTASDLKELVEEYKGVYVKAKGEEFPSGMYRVSYVPAGCNTVLGLNLIWR